jgi:hypothetical protein
LRFRPQRLATGRRIQSMVMARIAVNAMAALATK